MTIEKIVECGITHVVLNSGNVETLMDNRIHFIEYNSIGGKGLVAKYKVVKIVHRHRALYVRLKDIDFKKTVNIPINKEIIKREKGGLPYGMEM